MKDNQNKKEPLLEQWAKQYIEEDGRRLSEEARQLEERGPAPLPRLDGRVRSFLAARKRGRYVAAFGAMAAGLLLLFLLPRLGPLSPEPVMSGVSQDAAPTAESTADASALRFAAEEPAGGGAMEDAAPQEASEAMRAEEPPSSLKKTDIPPLMEAESAAVPQELDAAAPVPAVTGLPAPAAAAPALMEDAEEADAFAPSMEAAVPSANIIPLSFTLPSGFTVDNFREDRGQTIYHLANEALDDVVLSVEDASQSPPPVTETLTPVRSSAGDIAYGQSGPDAQFLTFERDGLRYRLTCRHDMQTLLSLWQHISAS